MADYRAPGVYVESIRPMNRPIETETSDVLAVIGFIGSDAKTKTPGFVQGWAQFAENYGKPVEFDRKDDNKSKFRGQLHAAVDGYFRNGGARVFVVPVPLTGPDLPAVADQKFLGQDWEGIRKALERRGDVTMVISPDVAAVADVAPPGVNFLKAHYTALVKHCATARNRVAILDYTRSLPAQEDLKDGLTGLGHDENDHAALYYPWIRNRGSFEVAPSGHVAGVYARVAIKRGVHKAPANEELGDAVGLTYEVTEAEQGTLVPMGVNCIRSFAGRGIRVWGARTLAATDVNLRYVNVRRLLGTVQAALVAELEDSVFEPNDRVLWAAIRRNITAYLTTLWRRGALFGSAPEEAFYVKVDDETNPPDQRKQGKLVVEVGIAPTTPAEFIVLRIGRSDAGTTVTTAS